MKARYSLKTSPLSSHSQLLDLVDPAGRRVLDVGCGEGHLSAALSERGHDVLSLDRDPPPRDLPRFVRADITRRLPLREQDLFDVILLADVLEHVAEPERLLERTVLHLAPNGQMLVSLPNVVHWSVRLQLLSGRFEYTNRGILDRGHLRFFTRSSAERLFRQAGLCVRRHRTVPVPWENLVPKGLPLVRKALERADHHLSRTNPNLFAYQHVFELRHANPVVSLPN